MKIFLFVAVLLCGICTTQAQTGSNNNPVLISTKGDTVKTDIADTIFSKVEIESKFPGGIEKWQRYLQQNLFYPSDAIKNDIQGVVVVEFIVCTDGTVCNVKAVSGPYELRRPAVNAFRKTPNWIPATQGGKLVKSYKKQPIVFRIPPTAGNNENRPDNWPTRN
jgi:periplasmic protein TonB